MNPRTPPRAAGPVTGTVVVPGSKSITNRALVCAALAVGDSTLRGALVADDTEAMTVALGRLGVHTEWRGTDLVVGSDGPRVETATLDARQSGTTGRFLLPLLGLYAGPLRLDGDEQLRGRPMAPALDALRSIGATIAEHGEPGHLPVTISGPVAGGEIEVAGDVSSQFLSGLLLAGPLMPGGLRATVSTELVSEPYVEMTASVMRVFGATIDRDGDTWIVEPTGYIGCDYDIEPDASAASYFWAAAAITGGSVTVEGLGPDALQGDVHFVDVLEQMGATVDRAPTAITVHGPAALRGIDVDMAAISDTVPTLAVVAAEAAGTTTIRNVGFIRHKESDRIGDVVTELRRCGVVADETPDGLVIGGGDPSPAVVQTYRDHRMAMAFALRGLVHEGIQIADPDCVAKTVPRFWDLLDALVSGRPVPAR